MSSTTLRGLWAHATNSQKLLDTALNSKINFGLIKIKRQKYVVYYYILYFIDKCINFIEADVIIGRLKGDTSQR